MTMSRRTTAKASARSSSRARRPFSAVAYRCPSRSRPRTSSDRLTGSSSTTRTYAPSSATVPLCAHRGECSLDTGEVVLDRCEELCTLIDRASLRGGLERLAEVRERRRSESSRIGFESVGRPAQLVGVTGPLSASYARQQLRGTPKEGVHE